MATKRASDVKVCQELVGRMPGRFALHVLLVCTLKPGPEGRIEWRYNRRWP